MSMTLSHARHSSIRFWIVLLSATASVGLAVIVAVASTTTLADANGARPVRHAAEATEPAAATSTAGSGVPDATNAFSSREMPYEEPAPTF